MKKLLRRTIRLTKGGQITVSETADSMALQIIEPKRVIGKDSQGLSHYEGIDLTVPEITKLIAAIAQISLKLREQDARRSL